MATRKATLPKAVRIAKAIESLARQVPTGLALDGGDETGSTPLTRFRRASEELGSLYEYDVWLRASAGCTGAAVALAAGLADQLRRPAAATPAFALARSVAETSARGWWLLEPDASPVERLRRGLNEAMHGAHEAGRFIAETQQDVRFALGLQQQKQRGVMDEGMKRLADDLASWGPTHGYTVKKSRSGIPGLSAEGAEARPDAAAAIDALLAWTDPQHVLGLGAAMYRVTSAVAHGSWHARTILGYDPDDPAEALLQPAPTSEGVFAAHQATRCLLGMLQAAIAFTGARSRDLGRALDGLGEALSDTE